MTTAGARRFAPSKSILIRLEELRRMEARHSDTTFGEINQIIELRSGHLIRPNFHSLLDGHVKPKIDKKLFLFKTDQIYVNK